MSAALLASFNLDTSVRAADIEPVEIRKNNLAAYSEMKQFHRHIESIPLSLQATSACHLYITNWK